jgi:hypothetical protein
VEYVADIPRQIQNIIGIELRNFSIPTAVTPLLTGRFDTPAGLFDIAPADPTASTRAIEPGNSKMDVLLTSKAPYTPSTALLEIDMESGFLGLVNIAGYPALGSSVWLFLVNFLVTLEYLIIALDHPVFTTADWKFGRTSTPSVVPSIFKDIPASIIFPDSVSSGKRYGIFLQNTGAPFGFADVSLLFASGPNEASSMHRFLGFDKVDTIPDPIYGGILGTFPVNLNPLRYVDVTVREIPEFKPLARVYLNHHDYTRPTNQLPKCVRYLKDPVDRLDSITVSLRLEDGMRLATPIDPSHFLEFEILSLESTNNIPSWVHQEFSY